MIDQLDDDDDAINLGSVMYIRMSQEGGIIIITIILSSVHFPSIPRLARTFVLSNLCGYINFENKQNNASYTTNTTTTKTTAPLLIANCTKIARLKYYYSLSRLFPIHLSEAFVGYF